MDLNIYQIIRGPVLSSKAFTLNRFSKKLVLDVHPQATKPQIKDALKKIFNIQGIEKINIVCRQGKFKRVGGKIKSKGVFRKRAIITLSGEQPDVLNQTQIVSQAAT